MGNQRKKLVGSSSTATIRRMLREHDLATRELKMNTFITNGTLSSAGVTAGITNNISQGDNVSGRTGYVIHLRSLKAWFSATLDPNQTTSRFRYILFCDRLNTGALPAVTDVLDTASVVSDYAYFARTQNRFKILVDKTIPMSISGNSRAVNYEHEFVFKKPVPVSLLGTTTNYGKNSFFFLIMDGVASNNTTYLCSFTTRYFDD